MKKILSFILVLIMVMSMGLVSTFAQENETEILPPTDNATKDEASADEASKDEASTDEEIYASMVFDYILTLTKGDNPFESENRPYLDGVKIPHEFELVYLCDEGASARFAIVDINFPEDTYDVGVHFVKVGNAVIFNEVHTLVAPFVGMGYYVVLPDKGEVMQLRDAIRLGVDGLKDVCLEKGLMRLLGDADANGNVDIKDATYIQKYVAGFEGFESEEYYGFGFEFSFADFDGDMDVNVRDATNVQKYLAGLAFDFMDQKGISFTEIPENAEPLEIEIDSDEPGCYDKYGIIVEFITSADEFSQVVGEEIEVYNEAFFKEKNLVYIRRAFGSGSFDLEILGAYMWGQDTIFIDSCFMTVPPGGAATDDVVCYRAFIAVDKSATEFVENVVVYEDNDFNILGVYC